MNLRNHIVQNMLAALLSMIVFIVASYSNTFSYLPSSVVFKFFISFIWGICLNKYFTNIYSYWVSVITFGLFSIVLFAGGILFFFSSKFKIIDTFSNYSFVWFGFLLGYYWKKTIILLKWIYLSLVTIFSFVYLVILYPSYSGSLRSDDASAAVKAKFTHAPLLNTPLSAFTKGVKLYAGESILDNVFPKGKVYLLDFYFETCAPCKMKAKDLIGLADKFSNKEFKIVYIDFGKIDDIKNFIKLHGSSFDQYYDNDGIFVANLNINSFPFEVIVDKKGTIRFVGSGYNPGYKDQYLKETAEKIQLLISEG